MPVADAPSKSVQADLQSYGHHPNKITRAGLEHDFTHTHSLRDQHASGPVPDMGEGNRDPLNKPW